MKSLQLLTGDSIPTVGYGWAGIDPEILPSRLETAIDSGYRHIDGAWLYGGEKVIGDTLHKLIGQGKIKRSDLFITSKLWATHHKTCDVRPAVMKSLEDLKTEYLDLYLMHTPMAFKEQGEDKWKPDPFAEPVSDDIDYVETWKAMEKLLEEGLVKQIGVSNFNIYQLKRLINETGTIPSVNQVEIHTLLPQKELVDFCHQHKIVVTAYSPLGSPGLVNSGKLAWDSTNDINPLVHPPVLDIAKKYNKNSGQILLRNLLQRGLVVICSTKTEERIKSNIQLFDFELTPEEAAVINKLGDANRRYWFCPNGFPFTKEKLKYLPFPDGEYTE